VQASKKKLAEAVLRNDTVAVSTNRSRYAALVIENMIIKVPFCTLYNPRQTIDFTLTAPFAGASQSGCRRFDPGLPLQSTPIRDYPVSMRVS